MIRLSQVGKEFDDTWIFRGLSLNIPTGGACALVGPSGSGKSVLLKLIAGLIRPDEGTVEVSSQRLGMLFQNNALFDSLTVGENLLFPLKEALGVDGEAAHERMRAHLDDVGLTGTEALFPESLSGGMQKRLGIARALIVEPEVILYDEPTAGLDPITSRRIADLIIKLSKNAKTTLFMVTNDMQRAYQTAKQIYLLAKGELVDGGTPEQVRATQHPAFKQFIFGLRSGPLSNTAHVVREELP